MPSNDSVANDLRWKKFPLLSDGFVCLVDVMGDDYSVVQAARVSYGKDTRFNQVCSGGGEPYLDQSEKSKKEDLNLLRYLMRHRHTTPFEMAEVKLLIRVPMDLWRQWIRHRTANVNEYSTRYAPAIDSMDVTPPDAWRSQSGANKQGSSGFVTEWPKALKPDGEGLISAGDYLSTEERNFHDQARRLYEKRLALGVAKEQARKDLPLSNYTEAYWKCDLHNVLHFLGLRMDSHAQKEIRDYATTVGEQIIKPLFPAVWEAFVDYRMKAMQMTRLDIEVIQEIRSLEGFLLVGEHEAADKEKRFLAACTNLGFWPEDKSRERDECRAKLERLSLLPTKI